MENKKALVNFFDGATGLMQMLLFFLLGLLSFPSQLPAIAPTALAVALFLTFVARPAVVFLLMAPFRSSPPSDGPGRLVGDAGGGLHRVLHLMG